MRFFFLSTVFNHIHAYEVNSLIVFVSPSVTFLPGEEIEVTGIYTHSYDLNLSKKTGFPVFGTLIEANYIQKRQDQFSVHRLTDDDRREILALARDPQVHLLCAISKDCYVFDGP